MIGNTQLSVGNGTITGAISALNTDFNAIGKKTRQQFATSFKIAPNSWKEIMEISLSPGVYLVIASAMFQNKINSSEAKSITIRSNIDQIIRDSVYVTPGNIYSSCITDMFGSLNDVTYKIDAWTDSSDIDFMNGVITAIKLRDA